MPVVLVFQRQVTQPAIRMDYAVRLNAILNKENQAVCGCVQDAPHSDAADTGPVFFRCNSNHGFGFRLASVNPFLFAAHKGFVHLDAPAQPISPRTHHGAA